MLETPHVAVAAAIAYKIPNPVISLPLAFASHFVFDKYPHWNPKINSEKERYGAVTRSSKIIIAVDVVLALLTGTVIASARLPDTRHFVWIILSCFVAVLPDLVEAPFYFLGIESKGIKKWVRFKRTIQVDISLFWGLFTQIIVLLAAFYWVFN